VRDELEEFYNSDWREVKVKSFKEYSKDTVSTAIKPHEGHLIYMVAVVGGAWTSI
jgi:hypothetical protein